jgi:hypothetical protein
LASGFVALHVFASSAIADVEFATEKLRVVIDRRGSLSSLYDIPHKREYLSAKASAPLLSIKADGLWEEPASLTYSAKTQTATVVYPKSGITAYVKIVARPTHVVLELMGLQPEGRADWIRWGPYPTTITETVGEIVGVVRDGTYALGIQALNIKTLGGTPLNEEGVEPSRGRAAERKQWGSALQAYSLDRSRPRSIPVWDGNFPGMPVPAIKGESLVGSKIALFGTPDSAALETIGKIELAEGLPHPLIDGVWAKLSTETGRSYLIADFSEETIDELLGFTRRAGLMSLYHMDPFESWGHYEISRKNFPHGAAGLRKCVEKAKAMGIRLGGHTLTSFINTHDPYVTPVPDPRLAKTGSSRLVEEVDSSATVIPVASPEYFSNEKANWLHTVVIDQELIRYRAVSATTPWKLLDCERGAFGTRRSPHRLKSEVGKLLDHSYKVFFPNIELQNVIATGLAKRFNETGLRHLDFDGREGCWSTGQGDYAQDLFARVFYDNLDHEVINGTSTSTHFYWHINTYCNWGEPWGGGFRETMQEYRISNQALFERNYLPNMLGWYQLTETTSLAEMEWMLARGAGYNAGFAMATSLVSLRKNEDTHLLLDAIREWEKARHAGAFTREQRERLRNPRNGFHLEPLGDDDWNLSPFHESPEYERASAAPPPSDTSASRWEFRNPDGEQPLQFRLRVTGDSGSITNPVIVADGSSALKLPVALKVGESLVCDGTTRLRTYDAKGLQTGIVQSPIPGIRKGKQTILFTCGFVGEPTLKAVLTFTTVGEPERIGKGRRK